LQRHAPTRPDPGGRRRGGPVRRRSGRRRGLDRARDHLGWTAPVTISAPHTFVLDLEAATAGDGTVVGDWGFQDGAGNGAARGARAASLAPGAAAFGPERRLPRDVGQVVPYARRRRRA
jgi:hypothetical protein